LHIGNEFFASKMLTIDYNCVDQAGLLFSTFHYVNEIRLKEGEAIAITADEKRIVDEKAQAYCDYVYHFYGETIKYLHGQ
jgi:hypothetical protein